MTNIYRNTPESFWRRVDQSGDCWVWTGSKTPYGYGTVRWSGERLYAHRLAFTLVHGVIGAGMFVCHRCDNPPCCKPAHLFIGTPADNVADRNAKGRTVSVARPGESSPAAKLRASTVLAVRYAHEAGASMKELAVAHGVHPNTIQSIVSGRSWRCVGGPLRPASRRMAEGQGGK